MDKTRKQEPVSIRYIDAELYTRLSEIAKVKGCKSDKKTDIFNFIFEDYINMHELDQFKNPYLIKAIQEVIGSAVHETEIHLGNRLFKLVGECSLNLSILTQIIFTYMNKFEDDEESEKKLNEFRTIAVEQLRENKLSPLTYTKLIKNDEGS